MAQPAPSRRSAPCPRRARFPSAGRSLQRPGPWLPSPQPPTRRASPAARALRARGTSSPACGRCSLTAPRAAGPPPGLPGPARRRWGLSLPRPPPPTAALTPGAGASAAPSEPWAGAGPTGPARQTVQRQRAHGAPGGGRQRPGPPGVSGGSGPGEPADALAGDRYTVARCGDAAGLGPRQRRRPGGGAPAPACSGRQGLAALAGGRHPTDARQGGAHPRRAAGATVVSAWRRLVRWTPAPRGQQKGDNRTSIFAPLLTSEVISTLGIRRGGKREPSTARRRLLGVGCTPLFSLVAALYSR